MRFWAGSLEKKEVATRLAMRRAPRIHSQRRDIMFQKGRCPWSPAGLGAPRIRGASGPGGRGRVAPEPLVAGSTRPFEPLGRVLAPGLGKIFIGGRVSLSSHRYASRRVLCRALPGSGAFGEDGEDLFLLLGLALLEFAVAGFGAELF